MPLTDNQGNKLPQEKVHKRIKSANLRSLAAAQSKQDNAQHIRNDHCPQCGYRVRGAGHFLAKHHKS